VSEQLLNGTSAQIGQSMPYTLNCRQLTKHKYNKPKHSSKNTKQQTNPSLVIPLQHPTDKVITKLSIKQRQRQTELNRSMKISQIITACHA